MWGRLLPVSQNDQNQRQIAPITEKPRSPADRVRQIQELQAMSEAQAAGPAHQPAVVQAPVTQGAALRVADAFKVREVATDLVSRKGTPAEQKAYAAAQKGIDALFGGNNPEIILTGNPWKVIPFGDALPAIFELKKPAAEYEAKVPEQAVQTELGALFEVSLAPKAKAQEPVQKRAVLVDGGGRLAGAECRSTGDAERLFKGAPWLLPQSAMQPAAKWAVTVGRSSAFELSVTRPGAKAEVHSLNNFARPVDAKAGAAGNLDLSRYFRDGFDAARV